MRETRNEPHAGPADKIVEGGDLVGGDEAPRGGDVHHEEALGEVGAEQEVDLAHGNEEDDNLEDGPGEEKGGEVDPVLAKGGVDVGGGQFARHDGDDCKRKKEKDKTREGGALRRDGVGAVSSRGDFGACHWAPRPPDPTAR